MSSRERALLVGFVKYTAVIIVTWLLSYSAQFICSISIDGPGFSLSNHSINRLAVVTVIATIVFMVMWLGIISTDGCLVVLFVIMVFFGGAIAVIQLASSVFDWTPVTNGITRVVYFVLVVGWGWALYYAFWHEDSPN